jgi:hypothetical protein
MSEFIAVDGLTIDHSTGSLASGGTFTIINSASQKVKCSGKNVYSLQLQVSWSGGNYSGGVSGTALTTVPAIILATATKVKVEGNYVMRLGDSGIMSGTYTLAGSPPVPNTPFSGASIEITDAGQDKVKAK